MTNGSGAAVIKFPVLYAWYDFLNCPKVLCLQYCSELVVLGWKLKVFVRGSRICDCFVERVCAGDRVLVNSLGC